MCTKSGRSPWYVSGGAYANSSRPTIFASSRRAAEEISGPAEKHARLIRSQENMPSRTPHLGLKEVVDVAAVAEVDHEHEQFTVMHRVDNSVVAHTNPQ
jgi:hypothetical protein